MASKNGFRVGKHVSVTRGGQYLGIARVHSHELRANGNWIGVNFAQPRKPADVRYYRASNLELV